MATRAAFTISLACPPSAYEPLMAGRWRVVGPHYASRKPDRKNVNGLATEPEWAYAFIWPARHSYPLGLGSKVRISDEVRRCVVFFGYPDQSLGKGGINCIGTGFLLEHAGLGYLVTAAHLAHELGDDPFLVRLNKYNGTSDNIHIDQAEWFYHPDSTVDVALRPVFIDPKDGYNSIYLGGESLELTRDDLSKDGIGVGDFTYTIGLFRLMSGEKRNLPTCHFGTIALFLEDERIPVIDWTDANRRRTITVEGFLVESQSLDGLSGSPVFVRPQTVLDPTKTLHLDRGDWRPREGKSVLWPRVQLRLLGVWSSSWDAAPDPIRGAQRGTPGSIKVPLGMGVVVPCYKIVELLELQHVRENRNQLIAASHVRMFELQHTSPIDGSPLEPPIKSNGEPMSDSVISSPLTAQTALTCDYIYVDSFGKDMLIGVYSAFYYARELLHILRVAVYIRATAQEPGTYDVEYRFLGPHDALLLMPLKSKITLWPGHPYEPVSFVDLILNIQAPGIVKFLWKIRDGDWQTLTSFEVRRMLHANQKPAPASDGTPGARLNGQTGSGIDSGQE